MPFIPVPNTVFAEVLYSFHGQIIENTLYFEYAAEPSEAQIIELAETLAAQWIADVMSYLSNEITMTLVRTTSLHSATAPSYEFKTEVDGSIVAPSMPGSVCLVVKFSSLGRGRSSRGRIYISGLDEGSVSGNSISSVTGENIRAEVQSACVDTANLTGSTHVIVSRYTEGLPRIEGVTFPVTGYTLTDLNVDSQRRRLTGRGR